MQDLIIKFIERQKLKGVSEDEINKAVFIASNVAMAMANKEIMESGSQEVKDKVQVLAKLLIENPNEEKAEEGKRLVVNDKGETLEQVLTRCLDELLKKIV